MEKRPLNSGDLGEFMERHAVPGEIVYLEVPTPTVEVAAQALGVQPVQVAKSILFLVNAEPVLAIACGLTRVDQRIIAAHYEVGRKRVKLASPQEVLAVTGYEVGAMPPFGHARSLPTLIDHRVLEQVTLYAGGGSENAMLRISPQDILRVTRGQVVDLRLQGDGKRA